MKYNKSILILLLTALVIVSCGKDDDKTTRRVYVDDTDGVEYHLYDLYIDKYGNEGLVVYVEGDASYKYIQVISVDETITTWGPTGETILKGNPDSLVYNPNFSLAMLQCMKTRGIEHFPAQRWCDAKNNGEPYPRTSSWMLPAYLDWYGICGEHGINVDSINSHLVALGKTPLTKNDYYWMCDEDYDEYMSMVNSPNQNYDSDNRAVPCMPLIKGLMDKDFWIKKHKHRVRAVKVIQYYIDKR